MIASAFTRGDWESFDVLEGIEEVGLVILEFENARVLWEPFGAARVGLVPAILCVFFLVVISSVVLSCWVVVEEVVVV